MSVERNLATYQRLRQGPMWALLASHYAPMILAILQTHLYETRERKMASAVFHQVVASEIEFLRLNGHDMAQSAQQYIRMWVSEGWLKRTLPAGSNEEFYELTLAAIDAIRFVSGIERPHAAATESRLAVVINAATQLAKDTDTDKARRLDYLEAERTRIDEEIRQIEKGAMRVLPAEAAKERVREIIALSRSLVEDFARIGDQFVLLHKELRENIVTNEGTRGDVLEAQFHDIDLMEKSEAGRTFQAFWSLLSNREQDATLGDALSAVLSRKFAAALDKEERSFLSHFISDLHAEARKVHKIQHDFSRSLARFVQSQEYREQRFLQNLLREAQSAAIARRDAIRVQDKLQFVLQLTGVQRRSVSQVALFDPSMRVPAGDMAIGEAADIDPEMLREMVEESEIDYRGLIADVQDVVSRYGTSSIASVLSVHPARQGLGSIVGLMTLSTRGGRNDPCRMETVHWIHEGAQSVRARIPTFYFIPEQMHALR